MKKQHLDLEGTAPTWKCKSFMVRFQKCVSMLRIHGLMTDGEKRKILTRLRRRLIEQAAAKAKKDGAA